MYISALRLGKLLSSLPSLASQSGAKRSAKACVDALKQNDIMRAKQALKQWIADMGSMDPSAATSELLATAHVIFCTLSTSGVSVLKQTRPIDDLLVDEAAAATEPELCIPFHLRPTRLLLGGWRSFAIASLAWSSVHTPWNWDWPRVCTNAS
jgi:hypothetical protein